MCFLIYLYWHLYRNWLWFAKKKKDKTKQKQKQVLFLDCKRVQEKFYSACQLTLNGDTGRRRDHINIAFSFTCVCKASKFLLWKTHHMHDVFL